MAKKNKTSSVKNRMPPVNMEKVRALGYTIKMLSEKADGAIIWMNNTKDGYYVPQTLNEEELLYLNPPTEQEVFFYPVHDLNSNVLCLIITKDYMDVPKIWKALYDALDDYDNMPKEQVTTMRAVMDAQDWEIEDWIEGIKDIEATEMDCRKYLRLHVNKDFKEV